jgi:MFS family permease
MRTPCDEAVMRSAGAAVPCGAEGRTWILVATILGSSMAFIDSTVINVALPALQASFHATVVDLQWVVESYGLLLAALILVGGSFGDRFGRRLIFVAGVAIFAVASAGCGFASNIHQLIIARSLQGVRLGSAAYHTKSPIAAISRFIIDMGKRTSRSHPVRSRKIFRLSSRSWVKTRRYVFRIIDSSLVPFGMNN